MSLWNRIRDRIGGGAATATPCCLVDGRGWVRQRGSGSVAPRDMIRALQQLSRMGAREGWPVEAVFEGEALRKAGDGDAFDGVTVWYAGGRPAARDTILQRVRQLRRQRQAVTVATDDAELERALDGSGADFLRIETLRKAAEGGGEDPRAGGASGPRRRGGRRGGGGGGGGGGGRPRDRGPQNRPPKEKSEPKAPPDPVRDLIDVVE